MLHDHILAHGVPVALYSDKHRIFRISAKEVDHLAETQFSGEAWELGIECVLGHSVERANQTLQDRLVKEMRLEGVSDMDTATNVWLPGYIADFIRRFTVGAQRCLRRSFGLSEHP